MGMQRAILIALILCILGLPSIAEKPRIALVLSGGIVTRGLSEIGVIKALEEENIPVDYVAGTSMGAVLGSLLAQGYNADEIEMIAKSINWTQAFAQGQDYKNLLFGEKEKFGRYMLSLELDGFKPVIPASLVAPQKPSVLFTEISIKGLNTKKFNNFKIPFRANATDIETGEEIVFSSGYLPAVLRASSAVPVMMAPIEIDGRLLVDGGAVNNLPVNLVTEFNPDIIIAVNLGMGLKTKEEINSFLSVLSQSLAFPQKKAAEANRSLADVLIEPDIEKYGFADFNKIDEIIEVGYQAAKAKIPEIKRLIAEKGKTVPEKRASRFEYEPIIKISFFGNSVYAAEDLERLIASRTGEAFDLEKAQQDKRAIWRQYFSDGYKLVDVAGVFDPDSGALIYEIDEGYVELVQITGRKNLSNVFLQSKIRGHSVFNMKAVHANIDRLYATGYFESVNFAVVPGIDGWTVEYKVKEKKRNSLSVGMRYDTYEQLALLTDLKMKFFESQNFSNTLSLKIGNEFSARFISEFWPERFGNNLLGEATLFYDKKVQDIYSGSRVSSSFYYLPKGLKVAAKANVEPFGQVSSGILLTHVNYENIFSIFPDENIAKAFVRTEVDALDNPISPKGGFSAGLEYQQSALLLGGQYDFAKVIADASAYVSLPRSHVIFAKGYLQLGKGDLPLSESHRIGGATNLLGYGRTQYLGKHAATLRFGYRIPLFYSATGILENVYLSFLQDFGIAVNNISNFSTANAIGGYGAEIQADTILGLSSRLSVGMGQAAYLYFAIGNEF